MTNATLLEDPPGLTTRTFTVAELLNRFDGTTAVSCPELMNDVLTGVPANCTTDPLIKLDPFTVIVTCCAPGPIEGGKSALTPGDTMLNATDLEALTDTVAEPIAFSREPGTTAVS